MDEHQEQGINNQPDSAPVSTESEVFIEVTVTDLPSSPDFKQIELLSTVNTSHWISFSGECILVDMSILRLFGQDGILSVIAILLDIRV